MLSTADWLWAELWYQNRCWAYLALGSSRGWMRLWVPCPVQEQQTTDIFCCLQNVKFPALEIRNYHLCAFILALYEKKQVASFKCVFVVYTSCLDIQKQKMAVYHSQEYNSLTFWGLWYSNFLHSMEFLGFFFKMVFLEEQESLQLVVLGLVWCLHFERQIRKKMRAQ